MDLILVRGPRDVPQLDQWFTLDEKRAYPEGRSILQLADRKPKAVEPHRTVHWSLLSDAEREQIFSSVGL